MKGIAVPYIIAIILGIAVVFIIGAGFFSSSGDLQKQSCQNKLSTYCTIYRGTGYNIEPSGGWDSFASECTKIGVTSPDETKCDEVLGKGTTTTVPTPTPTPAPSGTPPVLGEPPITNVPIGKK